jgi:hypothetical protein
MPAVVRYLWMFRTAAVLSVLFGLFWLIDATLTDRFAEVRSWLLVLGVAAIALGVMLFKRMRFAIVLSAVVAAAVCLASALGATQMHGPGILAMGVLSIVAALYAGLSARALFGRE